MENERLKTCSVVDLLRKQGIGCEKLHTRSNEPSSLSQKVTDMVSRRENKCVVTELQDAARVPVGASGWARNGARGRRSVQILSPIKKEPDSP